VKEKLVDISKAITTNARDHVRWSPRFLPHLKFKGPQSRLNGSKSLAELFNFAIFNPCQSSPSLTMLVPLCFVIISLVIFYHCKVLFSGFLQFNSNFVDAQNNSKYRDWSPLMSRSHLNGNLKKGRSLMSWKLVKQLGK